MEEVSRKKRLLSIYVVICVVAIFLRIVTGKQEFLMAIGLPIGICLAVFFIAANLFILAIVLVIVIVIVGIPVLGIAYLITSAFGIAFGPVYIAFKNALSFLLGLAAFKYVKRFRKNREIREGEELSKKKKEDKVEKDERPIAIVPVEQKFLIPRVSTDRDTYIGTLAERFNIKVNRKVLEERRKYMETGKAYLAAEYDVIKAQRKFEKIDEKFDEEDELEKIQFMVEKKRVLEELEMIDLEAEVKRKELEVQLVKLQTEEDRYKNPKEKPVEPKKEPVNPVVEALGKAKETISAWEEMKRETREQYKDDPEMVEFIIDGLHRFLFERGLMWDEEEED